MEITATRKHFPPPRAAALHHIRAYLRDWLYYLATQPRIAASRRAMRDLIGAATAALDSWRPFETERGRKLLDRLQLVGQRASALTFEAHARSGPLISEIYDRLVHALGLAARGVRDLSEYAAARPQAALAALVLGLPAVCFVFFAFVHWVAGDDIAVTTRTIVSDEPASRGAYRPLDDVLRISSTLVEPPAHGSRLPAAPLIMAPDDAPTPDILTVREFRTEPADGRAATADVSFPTPDRPPPAGTAETAHMAALSPSPASPATDAPAEAAPDDADFSRYPFRPRPRPSRGADAPTATKHARVATEPEPSNGVGEAGDDAYSVQLAAVRDRERATVMWRRLIEPHADLLGRLEPMVSARTTRQNRQIYRLRAGPLASKSDAEALCTALKSRKVDCLVVWASD